MSIYSATIILTELMMFAMTLHVVRYTGFTRTQKNWYICTFVAIMICAAAEFALHCGYYQASYAEMLTSATVIQFSLAPVLAVLFSGALGLENQRRNAIILGTFSTLVEIILAPYGLVFFFDESGYNRGPCFYIYEILFGFSLLYLIFSMMRVGRKFRFRDNRTIWMIIVILIAGILPMAAFKLNVTYIAIAFAASLCYIYYNDLVQQDIQQELIHNQQKVSEMQDQIISSLANLIENRDIETGEHVARTSGFVATLARDAMEDGVYTDELDEAFLEKIHMLAPMHDVGKIVVSDTILRKPGRLTDEEFRQMQRHASAGGAIIQDVFGGVTDEEYLEFAKDIAACHHEKWDGSGYPAGLAGEEIPLSARIMAIADVYDALVSERCYKKPFPVEEAVQIIREGAGAHFDPKLVDVFLRHLEDFA